MTKSFSFPSFVWFCFLVIKLLSRPMYCCCQGQLGQTTDCPTFLKLIWSKGLVREMGAPMFWNEIYKLWKFEVFEIVFIFLFIFRQKTKNEKKTRTPGSHKVHCVQDRSNIYTLYSLNKPCGHSFTLNGWVLARKEITIHKVLTAGVSMQPAY